MRKNLGVVAVSVSALLLFASSGARAASCDPGKPGEDLSFEEAQKVYDCLKADLYAGYQKGKKRWIPVEHVKNYRDWTPVSAMPANPGFHGGRFLFTYVNETGASEYLKYAEENVKMPAGTLIAKESFAVTDKGKVKRGPLFFMEKVADGKSSKTNDWYYYAVAPNGAPMGVPVVKACHQCHNDNFGDRDGLGYPVEEARIAK